MCARMLTTALMALVLLVGSVPDASAQTTRVVITPSGHLQVSWAPPAAKPVIAQPWCGACPGTQDVWIRATVESDRPVSSVSHDISATWTSNLPMNNQPFTVRLQPNPLNPLQARVRVRTHCSDQLQNVSRELSGGVMPFIDLNWTHTPFQETFHLTGTVTVQFTDGTPAATIPIDQNVEIYEHGCGQSGAPPCVPGGAGGSTLTAGNYTFVWKAPDSLIWQNSPKGELVVDTGVPSLSAAKAVAAGTGPVIIYQTANRVRYKMYESFTGNEVASGEVGPGALANAEFIPMPYGAKALVTVREGGQQAAYYMFTIDQWGKAGTTRQVGNKLSTTKAHWTVQYRSIFYLFEFDPSSGTLTVKDNYKGWSTTIDTGVSGLIVPGGTGGGPVVVYEKQKAVYGALVHWERGSVKERIALGTGTLLHAGFTLRGSYGANGTALIQTSPTAAENVSFTLDLWGDVGSTGVKTKTPLPSGSPMPPVPAPGFPGGGMSVSSTACDEGDCDRDGFSDEFERLAGTDPSKDTSSPSIDQSIVLLLDASGSMGNNNKMEDAKKAAIAALSSLNRTTEIAVIAYSGGCNDQFPVVACFSQDSAYLATQIQGIQPGGGTPMSPALLQAREYLWKKSHGRQGRIILLCDGQNDCPPNETDAATKIYQRIISTNLRGQPALDAACAPTSLARLAQSVLPVVQAAPRIVGFTDPRQDPNAAAAGSPVALRTAPGSGQGGPDEIPPGSTGVALPPGDDLAVDVYMGSPAVLPPGATAPQKIDPVPYVEPYGSTGVDTTATGGGFGVRTQMPIAVSTIGFGLQSDPQALQKLAAVAQAGGGQNFDAANLSQLTSAFSQAIVGTSGGGGGGGGGAVLPASGWNPALIGLVLLIGGSAILAVAIAVLKARGGSTATTGRARIRVAGGDGATRAVEIAGRTTIGRAGSNVLVLTDPEVSSAHAVIEVTPQGCVIRDLGSANGTTVNGQRVSEAALRPGDEIGVGTTRILFDG